MAIEEELSIDNILTEAEVENLFVEDTEEQETPEETTQEETSEDNKKEQNSNKDKDTTEVDVDNLFTGEPEGVGSKDSEEKKDTVNSESSTSSNKLYSSIAQALGNDGIFPDLSEEDINNVKSAEDLRALIDKHIESELTEKQKTLDEAMNAGMQPSEVQYYEKVMGTLDNISNEDLENENEQWENVRKNLIYQDFINAGYSEERAKREVTKSLNAGTDIEDAKEALLSSKKFYKRAYDSLLQKAENEKKQEEERIKKQAEELENSIMNDDKLFGSANIDKATRKKIYDSISKPSYKDPDTGKYLTSIQRFQKEHSTEFLKILGTIYTLTDNFKNFDKLVSHKEKKEFLKELEHTLNNTARNSDGSLKFTSGVDDDSESYLGKGWKLDI